MRRWPEDLEYERVVLEVEDRRCDVCGGNTHVCDHRTRHLYTLEGALFLVNKLQHCADKACEGHHRTMSPEAEMSIAHPGWAIGWDVFAWIGHRRFARHWSVPQIRQELADTYAIPLSSDAIENYVRRYEVMVAARQQDPARLAAEYQGVTSVQLSIDGLQPEKGHETLYVVRELRRRRVWFAEALISSSEAEVRRLLVRAKKMAKRLGKPVSAWVSDKQQAFVKGIAAEFPGVPHRYCQNHFLRDLAKPMLEKDSRAKVQMRRKVRGLRAIEKDVQVTRTAKKKTSKRKSAKRRKRPTCPEQIPTPEASENDAEQVVLDYCSAVRGILNDSRRPAGGSMGCDAAPASTPRESSDVRRRAYPTRDCAGQVLATINEGAPPVATPPEELAEPLCRAHPVYPQTLWPHSAHFRARLEACQTQPQVATGTVPPRDQPPTGRPLDFLARPEHRTDAAPALVRQGGPVGGTHAARNAPLSEWSTCLLERRSGGMTASSAGMLPLYSERTRRLVARARQRRVFVHADTNKPYRLELADRAAFEELCTPGEEP